MARTAATGAEERPRGLSMLQLITTHPRERLFVHPLLWTGRHLDLLRCEFFDGGIIGAQSAHQAQPPTTGAPPMPSTPPLHSEGVMPEDIHAAERLATARDSLSDQEALSRLLGGLRRQR